MPTISRARTGCWTCRARRIKCDESRPICRRCERLGLSCGYGVRLVWHEESVARGVCHGRSKKNLHHEDRVRASDDSTRLASTRRMFLNTSVDDLQQYLSHDKRGPSILLQPSLTTSPTSMSTTLQDDPHLLSFFESTICSSSTLIDNAHCNPYRYLILPMALASDGLYHATLAIAANTIRLSNPSYCVPALEHHNRALCHLRILLRKDEWDERELDEIVGLVLMLCWFDISDNSCSSWVSHLIGYQNLLDIRTRQQQRQRRSAHSEQLSSFFNRYFAFHLVLARTAFKFDYNQFQLSDLVLKDHLVEAEADSDVIDTYMGLSPSLLLLINRVTEMAWSETNRDNYKVIEEQLESLQQVPPQEDPTTEANTECTAIAEANRLGALLLLHEVATISGRSTDQEAKSRCVEQILALILSKQTNMMRTAALPLWPLFLAGCCTSSDEERATVMQLFEELEGIRRFGNITPAMEVVQMVWKQRDLAAQDRKKKNGNSRQQFEWERAMTMLGNWKVSLT